MKRKGNRKKQKNKKGKISKADDVRGKPGR